MFPAKYLSSSPCVYGEEDFLVSLHVVRKTNDPPPRAESILAQGYNLNNFCRCPLEMSYAKYLSSSPSGFGEEDFSSFHYMYIRKPMTPRVKVNSDPRAII